MRALIVDMQVTIEQLNDSANADCKVVGKTLEDSVHGLRSATRWALDAAAQNAAEPLAGAVPYLMMFGTVCGGWMLGQSALVAASRLKEGGGDADFYSSKIKTARYYADHILPRAGALRHEVMHGAASLMALDEAAF
jgi:hypothetical protein